MDGLEPTGYWPVLTSGGTGELCPHCADLRAQLETANTAYASVAHESRELESDLRARLEQMTALYENEGVIANGLVEALEKADAYIAHLESELQTARDALGAVQLWFDAEDGPSAKYGDAPKPRETTFGQRVTMCREADDLVRVALKELEEDERMTLTPKQIAGIELESTHGDMLYVPDGKASDAVDTLTAYADIVQRVAEMNEWQAQAGGMCQCPFHEEVYQDEDGEYWEMGPLDHAPDCLYLAARKLRGME